MQQGYWEKAREELLATPPHFMPLLARERSAFRMGRSEISKGVLDRLLQALQ
jgi:hypothetical protein